MVFSSNIFLFFFLPITLALYYLTPRRGRNLTLLLTSLVFYGWGEPVYLLLMVFTILLNYFCGLWIAARQARGRSAKAALTVSVVLNLALLGTFKYAGLFARSLRLLPGLGGLPVPELVLPIGISFYIFQSMSYVIDLYRGRASLQRSPLRFGAYVAMFPQLIAGPIVRYRDVAEQLESRRENLPQFAAGVSLFILGLSKKLLLANPMGALWENLQTQPGCLSAWCGMFAYTLQIYFDFSGYSDMAIGLGRIFGFDFPENFNYPYTALSITEFWRRWHISLSSWFRDYVYIPLGGNRVSRLRWLRNLLIVWALTGLWHGASWNFVLWGLYYGLLLAAEKLFLGRLLEKLPRLLRWALTFLVVMLGWVLFNLTDFAQLADVLGRMFRFAPTDWAAMLADDLSLAKAALVLPAGLLCALPLTRRLRQAEGLWPELARMAGSLVLLLLSLMLLFSTRYNPFIYFRF